MEQLIKVNEAKATKVLDQIDSLMQKVKQAVTSAESNFMSLAFLLLEAKRGAYWTLRDFKTENDYIKSVFPQSRAQYYRLIRIGTHLQKYDRKLIESMGSSKAEDLVRLHVHFDGDIPKEWIKKAESLDKDSFRRSVRNHLDEKDEKKKKDDPTVEDQFITFRIFGDGIDIVNAAFEQLKRKAGSDKSLGHLLVLMCANELAGPLDDGTVPIAGKNSFILSSIKLFAQQLDLSQPNASEMLIGTIAAAIDSNKATPNQELPCQSHFSKTSG